MVKGDIVLIDFPFTDLSGQKKRPALVLYNDMKSENSIFAFITSDKVKRTLTFDIKLKKSKSNGLKEDSVIKLDKIATLNRKMAIRYFGKLEQNYMAEVHKKLKQLFKI